MYSHKQEGLPPSQTQKRQTEVQHKVGQKQAAFEPVILRSGVHQKLDAVDLQSYRNRHQRGKQEERLVFHQKLLDPAHPLKILRTRKVEKGDLNVRVHPHLIRMTVVTIMF